MRLRVPHTFTLLFGMIVLAAVATHFIPAGQYERIEKAGRQVVDPASYHAVEVRPAGLAEVFLAYPRGLEEAAPIVFFIFLIGGALGVVQATGAMDAAIAALVRTCGGRGPLVLGVLMLLFSVGGATIGMAEETLAFLPALVVLARRLGYDEITGGAVALVGAGAGFAGAFMNPFTVGIGQAITGLPPLSGMGYRLIAWGVVTTLAIAYVLFYARGVRSRLGGAAERETGVAVPQASEERPEALLETRATARQRVVMVLLIAGLGALALGAVRWHWGSPGRGSTPSRASSASSTTAAA